MIAVAPEIARSRRVYAFPKQNRLLHRTEYLRVQGRAGRLYTSRLIFQFLPGQRSVSRIGITVSKKVGNAVTRNRIKRWVREIFRLHPELRPEDNAATRGTKVHAFDLVITAKKDASDFSYHALREEIIPQLERFLEGKFDGRMHRSQRRRRGRRT